MKMKDKILEKIVDAERPPEEDVEEVLYPMGPQL